MGSSPSKKKKKEDEAKASLHNSPSIVVIDQSLHKQNAQPDDLRLGQLPLAGSSKDIPATSGVTSLNNIVASDMVKSDAKQAGTVSGPAVFPKDTHKLNKVEEGKQQHHHHHHNGQSHNHHRHHHHDNNNNINGQSSSNASKNSVQVKSQVAVGGPLRKETDGVMSTKEIRIFSPRREGEEGKGNSDEEKTPVAQQPKLAFKFEMKSKRSSQKVGESNIENVNKNVIRPGFQSLPTSPRQRIAPLKLQKAEIQELSAVKFDLLNLVQQTHRASESYRQQPSYHRATQSVSEVRDFGGGNFLDGSTFDLFGIHNNYVNGFGSPAATTGSGGAGSNNNVGGFTSMNSETRVAEIQESLRCDTDLLAIITANMSTNATYNGNSNSNINTRSGFTARLSKRNSRNSIMGLKPLVLPSDLNNAAGTTYDNSFETDDYNLSPISRKASVQYTYGTFGDFQSLAYIEKQTIDQHGSFDQQSNLDMSVRSDAPAIGGQNAPANNNNNNTNNGYHHLSMPPLVTGGSIDRTGVSTVSSPKEMFEEGILGIAGPIQNVKRSVKRQSSVRFLLPSNNLEKIRERDEKEEGAVENFRALDMVRRESILRGYRRDSIQETLPPPGIVEISSELQQQEQSQLQQEQQQSPEGGQDISTSMISKVESQGSISDDEASEDSKSIAGVIHRIEEIPALVERRQGAFQARNSIFFLQTRQLTEMQEHEEDGSVNSSSHSSHPGAPLQTETESEQPQFLSEQKLNLPEGRSPIGRSIDNGAVGSPVNTNRMNTSTFLGHANSSIMHNSSYVAVFNKNPDSSVIETSSVKREIDQEGKKKINRYTLLKELGRGGFGKVKLASIGDDNQLSPDNHRVTEFAIKISNKRALKRKLVSMKVNAYTLLEREVAIMKKIDHPHLVKLYEVIDDPDDEKIYMVMEYMQKGSIMSNTYWKKELINTNPELYAKIYQDTANNRRKSNADLLPKHLPLDKCRKYFQQFALAIDYMHNYAQVIHRDIKPENILINEDDNLKIGDFGVSHIMESNEDSIRENAGTKAFTAPEGWSKQFKGKPLDMWASGVTLFFIAFGHLPFFSKDQIVLRNMIINDPVVIPPGTEEELSDLIEKLLAKNPDERITAKQMLVHPWLTLNGEITLQNSELSDVKVSDRDIQTAFTPKIHFTTLMKVKMRLSRQLTRARSFLQASMIDQSHDQIIQTGDA